MVLSSCKSALGENVPGEGFVGLPRPSSLRDSLRRDQPLGCGGQTNVGTDGAFYRHLLGPEPMLDQRGPTGGSSRDSKTKEWNAPWFWAGFVAQGEWTFRPSPSTKNLSGFLLRTDPTKLRGQQTQSTSSPSSLRRRKSGWPAGAWESLIFQEGLWIQSLMKQPSPSTVTLHAIPAVMTGVTPSPSRLSPIQAGRPSSFRLPAGETATTKVSAPRHRTGGTIPPVFS